MDKELNSTASVPFEDALDKLQETVKKLESGTLSLEDALQEYEKGIQLSRLCQNYLQAAEQRVELLTKNSTLAKAELEPFVSGRNVPEHGIA